LDLPTARTRINEILYDGYAIEGSEVLLFGTECGRPISYAMDISDWPRLKIRVAIEMLAGPPIKLQIDNETNRIIDILEK
jgi:hypothetical protein